jgi:outer membrane usher protein
LAPQRRQNVLRPTDPSAFLNYRLDYSSVVGAKGALALNTETGLRLGNWLFTSEHTSLFGSANGRFTRLMSSLNYDRRDSLQRLILGDFLTASDDLGGGLNLGGISLSKRYDMDPYLCSATPVQA